MLLRNRGKGDRTRQFIDVLEVLEDDPETLRFSGLALVSVVLDKQEDPPFEKFVDDFLEAGIDLVAVHSHDRAVEVDVLASGHVAVKAGSYRDKRSDPSLDQDFSPVRGKNPGQQAQKRRLARSVGADQRESVSSAEEKT